MTRLVQAELLKLWTTRTARVLLALTAAGSAALVTLVLVLAGRPGQPALGDDALRQLVGVPNRPLTLAALVLGVLGMAGELRHGTATSTFLVTPVRGRVVAAKLAAAALAGLAMALVATAVGLAIGLPWLHAKGIGAGLADPGLGLRVAGLAAAVALYAVLGTGLAPWSATSSRPSSSGCCGCTAWRPSWSACCTGPASAGGCPRARPRP
jgi:ABC-2 type transport system permease protein